ncbi:PREDICTED: F-box/kelch-repeat protein At1g23390-like [Camelina sativa]|uniref:F-box/kelch-repeat protein At1g23390-like n=1 Tax=Camelina sativa TaxID=90675 RepID=A0ABM0WXN4_CAMSA|nr:PREDICTED: F-box/kelch-repeat protein At1g23390-like [Camelina sativa]
MENKKNNGEDEVEEGSIEGDVLESILSYLPLLDLDSASQVSKSWNRAVFFSLRRFKTLPWLFLYTQKTSQPYTLSTTAMAYDPKSDSWIELKSTSSSPPVEHVSVARSSHSTLLYALSPAGLSFSTDAFHLTWRHVAPPRVWRIDPIVAVVGRSLIVAGGVCDFEEDKFAVELFDDDAWEICESMPDSLYGSASATWLSVAASSEKMYVTEKSSGAAFSFDPETKSWTKLLDLCPGGFRLYSRSIGYSSESLIMAGITGDEDNPTGIELWGVIVSDESPMDSRFESIGSMPEACLDKLRGADSDWPLTSIAFNAVGDMVYIHDAAENGGEIVAAEIGEGGKLCKWRTLPNANAIWNNTSHAAERVIVACSNVGFSDLKFAFKNNLSFSTA